MNCNRRRLFGFAAAAAVAAAVPLMLDERPEIWGDGVHDDALGIQAATAGKPFYARNKCVTVEQFGGYRHVTFHGQKRHFVTGPMIWGESHVVMDGNGCTITGVARPGEPLVAIQASYIVVQNFNFDFRYGCGYPSPWGDVQSGYDFMFDWRKVEAA